MRTLNRRLTHLFALHVNGTLAVHHMARRPFSRPIPMIQLTTEQIIAIATAAQSSMTASADTYIHSAIEAIGVEPGEVSDEQYDEILNMIFQ